MKFSRPTLDQAISFGRHVVSYSAGAVTAAVALNLVTPDQGNVISKALGDVFSGLTTASGGIATLISLGAGLWAAHKQAPSVQRMSVASQPEVAQIALRPVSQEAVAQIADTSSPAAQKIVSASSVGTP